MCIKGGNLMWFQDWINATKNRKEVERLTKELELIQISKEELEYLDVKRELELIKEKFATERTHLEEEHLKLGIKLESEHMIQREKLNKKFEAEKQELLENSEKLKSLKQELAQYEDKYLMHEHGLYEPTFEFDTSEGYKNMLNTIRLEQKEMIRKKVATDHPNQYFVDGDKKRGKEFVNDTIKLSLRAFNNECDVIISNVKSTNLERSGTNIEKAFKQINSLTDMQTIFIRRQYLESKLRELYLKYELEVKKQEEKEEQRVIKEQMREEARVLKEIENARKKVEKEENHFHSAISSVRMKIEQANDVEKTALISKLAELEAKLAEVEVIKNDIENRERNTRAGYVYVISNIGSFGEHVYKIGMTRRLEPLDRIRELGSASVPFTFDIHAMVFSEDAPTLENKLHHRFAKKRVNQVNLRKEFFNVEINEIAKVIKEEFDETLEITLAAQAEDYHRTLQIREAAMTTL